MDRRTNAQGEFDREPSTLKVKPSCQILRPRKLPELLMAESDTSLPKLPEGAVRLVLDPERYAELRRPALYALTNSIISMLSDMGRAWDMKPAELQVFMIIGAAGLQRFVRLRPLPLEHTGDDPLPTTFLSGISRRQIAELTGLSRESVRRTVLRLLERGLVVEPSRGLLAHTPGMLQKGSTVFHPEEMVRPYVSMVEQLIRMGVVRIQHPG
jgi:DNA-binding MarR family transcriptional regulator